MFSSSPAPCGPTPMTVSQTHTVVTSVAIRVGLPLTKLAGSSPLKGERERERITNAPYDGNERVVKPNGYGWVEAKERD